MKQLLKSLIRFFLPIGLVLIINRALRAITAAGHRLQFILQWRIARHSPAWFDHFIDQHWKWSDTRNPSSWQRGIFGSFAMQPGSRVLDLCCGGGFYSYHFYSTKAASIIAMDYDQTAIRHARRNFKALNLEFRCGDIRSDMPAGEFDNICWDAGIEYFTLPETENILAQIRDRLGSNGLLSGCGIIAQSSKRSHTSHKHEFTSPQELAELLGRFFGNVHILNSAHADKHLERSTFHFFASNGSLPFDRPVATARSI